MADNLKDRGPQDRARINVNEEWELRYWTKELGVTEDRLVFEGVQHRQADVRLVEDQDVRRLRGLARHRHLFSQLGYGRTQQQGVSSLTQREFQADGQDRILTQQSRTPTVSA